MIRFDTKKDMEHYDNLYHQIIEKDKQLDKYKNVIDKIKEYCKKERNNILANFEYLETTDLDNILKLLEEVDG